MPFRFCAGSTAPLDFRLKDRAAGADLTNYQSIELILTDRSGVAVETSGDVTVTSAATGEVRFHPDAGDLVVGVFLARFHVVDVAGDHYYWPGQDQPMVWEVGPVTS